MERNLQQSPTQPPPQPAAAAPATPRPPLLTTPAFGRATTHSPPVLTLHRSFNGLFTSTPRLGFGHQLLTPASPSKRLSLSSRTVTTTSRESVQLTAPSLTSLPSSSLDSMAAPAIAPQHSAPIFAPFSASSPSISHFIDATSPVQPQDATTEELLVLEDGPEPQLPNPAEGDITPKGIMMHFCKMISFNVACYTAFKTLFEGQFNGKRAKLTPRGEGDDEDWEWRTISKPFVHDQELYVHVMWRHVSLFFMTPFTSCLQIRTGHEEETIKNLADFAYEQKQDQLNIKRYFHSLQNKKRTGEVRVITSNPGAREDEVTCIYASSLHHFHRKWMASAFLWPTTWHLLAVRSRFKFRLLGSSRVHRNSRLESGVCTFSFVSMKF